MIESQRQHYVGKAEVADSSALVVAEGISEDIQIGVHNKGKEENTMVYHFMTIEDGTLVRIVTNNPSADEVAKYVESLEAHSPYNNLMAITSGGWDHHLLQLRLATKQWRATVIGNELMDSIGIETRAAKSTFAWANASYSFFLEVEGSTDWGLKDLGIDVVDSLKTSKRLQEVLRQVEAYHYTENPDEIKILIRPRKQGDDVKKYDGKSYISKSFAVKILSSIPNHARRRRMVNGVLDGSIVSFVVRMIGDRLLKGDIYVHSDDNVGWDIITDAENLKGEISTQGFVFTSIWEHHTLGWAVWDYQSLVNFPSVLTETNHMRDLRKIELSIREEMDKGKIPDYMIYTSERAHNDDATPGVERLSDAMKPVYIRAQAAGLDFYAIQNFPNMAFGALLKQMRRSMDNRGEFNKTWIPMNNAFVATVSTWSSLTRMGGYKFPDQDGTKVFFDHRFGLVIPDHRFIDTFDLHGTWDLDDTVKVILVKVWASDPATNQRLINSKVIDGHVVLPLNEGDAVKMVALIRSPNGPGEISFEMFDAEEDGMPFFGLDEDAVAVVNMDAIRGQSEILANVTLGTIPTSVIYSKTAMTKQDSIRMIKAQLQNPGFGPTANAMMVYSAASRQSMPGIMLAELGQKVDAVQQGADVDSFKAIADDVKLIHSQLVDLIKTNNLRIDKYFVEFRLPAKVGRALEGYTGIGRISRITAGYKAVIESIDKDIKNQTMQKRHSLPIVQKVRALRFTEAQMKWAADTYFAQTKTLKDIDQMYVVPMGADPFTKMTIQHCKSQALKAAVDGFVAELQAMTKLNTRMLALWKFILMPYVATSKFDTLSKFGRFDRILAQGGTDLAVADLLINALIEEGLLPE